MANKPIVISFGNKSRAGRNTCAQAILDEFGSKYDIRVYRFSDVYKDKFDGHELELCLRLGVEPDPQNAWRNLRQKAMESVRKADTFAAVKFMHRRLLEDSPRVALIPDMHYPNEFLYVKALGGVTINVKRTGFVDLQTNTRHISEILLDPPVEYDITIDAADGEVDDLKKSALEGFRYIETLMTPVEEDFTVAALESEAAIMEHVTEVG